MGKSVVPDATSMTDTVLEALLTTYAEEPSGVIATPSGSDPTGMVDVTVPAAVAGR
jgi:hypothetical protein